MLEQRIKALEAEAWGLRIIERRATARVGYFVFADLDNFKAAQDAHPDGHAYGDRVLRAFVRFLRDNCRRNSDSVAARMGGDEFVAWVPSRTDAARLAALIETWTFHGTITATAAIGRTVAEADAHLVKKKRARSR